MSTHPYPECGAPMLEGWIALSGGLWFCESAELMDNWVAAKREQLTELHEMPDRESPLHTVVAGKGYLLGDWPKPGLHCTKCCTVTILGRSLGVIY